MKSPSRNLLPARSVLATAVCLAMAGPQTAAAQGASDDENSVDEIVVTGTKIERSLQDTTTSVAVFDADLIDKQNFVTLGDILNQTANVSSAFNEGVITIRGLRNDGAGSFDGTSNVSAVYVDGVFLPSSLFTSGALNLWDIESAEVFRGPQSTVQGRNALAGAIVLNTTDPFDEFEGTAQLQIADFGGVRASAAASIPVSDTLAFRLAVDENQTDGWIDNPTLGIDDSDNREASTIRAKALWTPTDALNITLNYTNIDAFRSQARVVSNEFPAQRITRENIQSRIDTEGDIASLDVDFQINDTWSLTSITAYTDTTQRFFTDATLDETGGPSASDFVSNDTVTSQEFRLNFETERARGLLGTFFFNQEGDTMQDSFSIVGTDFALPDPVTIAQIFFMTPTPSPIEIAQATAIRQGVVAAVPEFPVEFDRVNDQEIDNWAIFGEMDYDLTDKWTVTLGLRYDSEDIKQNIFDGTFVPPITVGDPLIDSVLGLLAGQFTNEVTVDNVDNDYDAWLPKVVFNYAWTDDISTAFSYQRGYRAGGLAVNIFRAALSPPGATQAELETLGVVNSFDPEFTNNYEIAFRSQLLDNKLTLNGNVFFIDYTDQQINVQLSSNPLDTLTENVGESELFGFEIDANYRVNINLTVGANLGHVDTEFTSASGILDNVLGGGLDLTGNEFSYAPQWTGGAYARYDWDAGWYVNGRVRISDASFTLPDNDPTAVADSFTVFDFIAGYESDRWRVEVFAENAFDKDYLTANFGPDDGAVSIAAAPRTVGGRVIFSF